jgi:hypothetical protein
MYRIHPYKFIIHIIYSFVAEEKDKGARKCGRKAAVRRGKIRGGGLAKGNHG